MDTEYTKGFKAGLAWEKESIIKILTAKYSELTKASRWADSNHYLQAIELIKGETNE